MIQQTLGASRLRTVLFLLIAAAAAVAAIDGGSIVITRMKVSDDLQSIGHAAALTVGNQPVNSTTAQAAYDAAVRVADDGETVVVEKFVVEPDGSIRITVRKTAPTLLAGRLGFTEKFVLIEDDITQPKIDY